MSRRVALLAAALVVALAGTTLIFSYFNQKSAAATEQQTSGAAVLVARGLIPAGTSGQAALDQGLVELTELPARAVVPGALTDLVPVATQVTGADIQPGEQVLAANFMSPAAAGALPVPDDRVAVSVELSTGAQRVANFVKPGVEVAVFNTFDVTQPAPGSPNPSGVPALPSGSAQPVVSKATALVVDRALVLAVGATTGAPSAATAEETDAAAEGEAAATSIVTLAVSIEDAQELAHAAQAGAVTLSLLTDQSRTGTAMPDDNRTLID